MPSVFRWGSPVRPGTFPVERSASARSNGMTKSCTGPSSLGMNDAEMVLRTRLDANGGRSQAVHLAHLAIDVEERDPLAVQRDFDLLSFGGLVVAEDLAETPVIEGDHDDVLAIGGEVVPHHEPAASPEGRSFDVPELRDRLRHDVRLDRGSHAFGSPTASRLIFPAARM